MCVNRKNYVPRHIRLGAFPDPVSFENFQDVIETIPVVDDSGSVVLSKTVIKSVPSSDVMRKYRYSAFRLSALVKSGVPLKVVNINACNSVTIDKLESVCRSIDSADLYVQRCLAQQKERESWLSPIDDSKTE